MAFKGWPGEAIEFFEGLEADNSKAFWQDHKDVYDTSVRAPMDALLAELESEFGPGKVFRPYRDVRFSADKTPYKTAIGATVGEAGYVQVSAQGLGLGAGMWMMASDQLDRYRRAVDDDSSGEALEALGARLRRAGMNLHGHDVLKTAPRGYPKDHPRIDLLRNKGLVAWREWAPGAWLGQRKAKDRIVKFLRDTQGLRDWLDANVGASNLPPR